MLQQSNNHDDLQHRRHSHQHCRHIYDIFLPLLLIWVTVHHGTITIGITYRRFLTFSVVHCEPMAALRCRFKMSFRCISNNTNLSFNICVKLISSIVFWNNTNSSFNVCDKMIFSIASGIAPIHSSIPLFNWYVC